MTVMFLCANDAVPPLFARYFAVKVFEPAVSPVSIAATENRDDGRFAAVATLNEEVSPLAATVVAPETA